MANGSRLPYLKDLFVNREEVLDIICNRVEMLVEGRLPPERRLLRVDGVAGSGKSWLMCRAQEVINEDFSGVLLFRLCLVDNAADLKLDEDWEQTFFKEGAKEAPSLVLEILQWLIQSALKARGSEGFGLYDHASLTELSHALFFELAATGQPCVLLVDGLDELPASDNPDTPGVVRLLADYVLIPLLLRDDVFMVLSARTPPAEGIATDLYRPELMPHTEDIGLLPFKESDVREQLEKAGAKAESTRVSPQAESGAAMITTIGGGYAYTNIVLARRLNLEGTAPADLGQALEDAAAALLIGIEPELRSYFEALCVLREFDLWRMQKMCKVYGIGETEELSYTTFSGANRVLRELVQTRLITASYADPGGLVMDAALRTILHSALFETKREKWEELHRAAEELYTEWSEKYPRRAAHWVAEAAYHHAYAEPNASLIPESLNWTMTDMGEQDEATSRAHQDEDGSA